MIFYFITDDDPDDADFEPESSETGKGKSKVVLLSIWPYLV